MKKKASTKNPVARGLGKTIPPPALFVQIYFDQKGRNVSEANAFFQFYSTNKWTIPNGDKVRDWKAAANNWIWGLIQGERLQPRGLTNRK